MVICNLYPFEKIIDSGKYNHYEAIENIDVGGASILRAAAKNYLDMLVITDISDYDFIADCIVNNKINENIKKDMASKVFKLLSNYDKKILDPRFW